MITKRDSAGRNPVVEADMRVLIQDCRSHQFYAGRGQWVESANQAKDFQGSVPALACITKEKLKHAQVVLKFPRTNLDVTLPTRECRDP
jgi:hypothetical protein